MISLKDAISLLEYPGKTVYGLVGDHIEKLNVCEVILTASPDLVYTAELIVETTSQPTTRHKVPPGGVYASINELLIQMAADYKAREKANKNNRK